MDVMLDRTSTARSLGVDQLEFDSLERFPCGCIAVVQRAQPWPVTVVSIEVQGPHCFLSHHRPGRVVRLGSSWELDEDDLYVEDEEAGGV
ncbi:MAG: hypothetical protein ACE148_06240 [Vicinamibacterales bacterium]